MTPTLIFTPAYTLTTTLPISGFLNGMSHHAAEQATAWNLTSGTAPLFAVLTFGVLVFNLLAWIKQWFRPTED